jgi:argininosuccinate lyase
MKKEVPQGWATGERGGRLTTEMSPLLYKYYYAPTTGKAMWEGFQRFKGFHIFDKAHVVMLTEERIIPKEVGIKILEALRQMEREGIQKVGEELGGMYFGEAYVTKILGPEIGGWVHCGRSSGDLVGVSYRVDARDAEIVVMKELIKIRETFLKRAEEHINTIMPGYSHLQHAEPITFAFYLLSWVHQFERDFERFQGAYKHTNISPAGCAILTTSDFPVNRKRTQELLGFDDIYTNARDAIWTVDYLLELLGALMGTAGALGKLADDLEIWHTSEFSLIEQPDAFCGTSSIMPQKKNSLGTECVRGLNGDVIGNVMAFLAVTKGQSESGESWAMAPFYLYNAAESCLAALQIMEGIVRDLKVNKEIMKERAGMFWTQATTLANTMVRERKIPFRMAHQIVGSLVKTTYEEGKKPEDVTPEMVDKAAREFGSEPLHLDDDTVRKALDPPTIVASKKAIGGTAPERVKEDIASGLKRIKEDETVVVTLEAKLATAGKKLRAAIDRIIGEHRR